MHTGETRAVNVDLIPPTSTLTETSTLYTDRHMDTQMNGQTS